MNLDPMMVMQGTYVVHGKLGMVSSFAISLANSSGLLESGISYEIEGSGADLRVTAKAMLKSSGKEISYSIGMKEARAEGWTKNPKYQTLPELMLRYRAATLLIRTHIPQVLNGMHMVEEIRDVQASTTKTVREEQKVETATPHSQLDSFLEQCESDEKLETLTIESSRVEELQQLIASKHVSDETVEKWCQAGGVGTLAELSEDKLVACLEFVRKKEIQASVEAKKTC
jgi:hypothetical protein